MRPAFRQQDKIFLAVVALLLGAAFLKNAFEAQSSTNRSARLRVLESCGFGIRYCFSQGEDNGILTKTGKLPVLRLPLAIIDGHPHNPMPLLVQYPPMVA